MRGLNPSVGGTIALVVFLAFAASPRLTAAEEPAGVVAATSIRGKAMCGYQGWFRLPGDAANLGWRHWSRDARRITPEALSFEMWPDVSEYDPTSLHPAPGFTHPDGRPASLFSSDHAATVRTHFEWMRDYGIDGAWLQQFLVELPGGQSPESEPSRRRVVDHVRHAAERTGRVWALSYDVAAMPTERIFDVLTADWKRMVDGAITRGPRYLQEGGRPVVQVWGFYHRNEQNRMTAEVAARLIDFFKEPGPYSAFLMGGGDWEWRKNPDPAWQAFLRRFDAYSPWNVGNTSMDAAGTRHASMGHWAEDKREAERRGVLWVPVVYPGFSWDNLKRQPPGTTTVPRNGGRFFWEQFHELTRLGADCVYIAMFDEVDEGTAIFKVTSTPPTQAHFVGYDGLPNDWYLRLAGEGARMLRGERPASAEIPIRP